MRLRDAVCFRIKMGAVLLLLSCGCSRVTLPLREDQDAICAHLDEDFTVANTAVTNAQRDVALTREYGALGVHLATAVLPAPPHNGS